MAEVSEKGGDATVSPNDDGHSPTPGSSHHEAATLELPRSWKYRQLGIGSYKFPYYASPQVQLVIVAFVCFLCPGMFNALSGLGGAGNLDPKPADDANMALYATFSVIGFFAGTFTNKIGIKLALAFGGTGYAIYVASFLSYAHNKNYGFAVFAGTYLGICAGILWCAQGAIMMSYPPEKSKGKYISWFWMIFNLGAVIGSLIPLGENIHVTSKATVSDGTYIGFLVLTLLGAALALTLTNANDVIRGDGSRVIMQKNPTWKSELMGLVETFKTDPYILFMFPMFFASNWFYAYHFNGVNGARFNTRTKALNGVIYYIMQIIGAYVFGYALDTPRFRRSVRAKAAWVAIFVLTFAIWGGGYDFQKEYTRADVAVPEDGSDPIIKALDWSDSGYGGPLVLYMFYGFYDAAFQTCVYWFMGAMTNNSRKLANFAGFYKGIQSAGSAIIWRLDSNKVPYMNLFASCWGLLAGGLIFALPLILTKIKDHVPIEEDLKFSDETLEDVVPTGSVSHQGGVGPATEKV
ncbi:hypothetical protein FKW77_003689 [Venturia effusa]|uniref:DUF895 domain membrane protein n=1 Tax=Venturia effusa TaxID=50376 RepID=A0A517LIF6_9PEZI|nr:hypothetical protein FKW77_003689 [Venturia effusa]